MVLCWGVLVKFKILSVGAIIAGFGTSELCHGQGYNLERLPNTVQASDGFATSRLLGMGETRFGLSLVADYANDPVVVSLQRPPDTESSLVQDYMAAHLVASIGVHDYVHLFVGLDVPFYINGEQMPALRNSVTFSDGGGIGDASLGGRFLLLGDDGDVFSLGAQATLTLPLSEAAPDQTYRGEENVTGFPLLIGQVQLPGVRFAANAGVLFRETTTTLDVDLGHDFRYAVAVGIPLGERAEILAEVFGASPLTDFADREGVNLEWLLGPKFNTSSGLFTGAAFGTGLAAGVGTPDYRFVVGLGYQSPAQEVAPPQPVPMVDPSDRCPGQDEDWDRFQDDDGCPDPDNDGDGIFDAQDTCPDQAEDVDGVDDADGCPEQAAPVVDSDRDSIPDPADACPTEPEDVDGFEDQDGCPDPDNDKDGVPDTADECPREPGLEQERGCPKSVRVSDNAIQILQQIQFATGQDTILEESHGLMNELVSVLNARNEIALVRVEGHTDDRGADPMNMDLSKRRAASVKNGLVARGVSAQRLEAWGCGESVPLEANTTAAGRAANRRVVFHILQPKPATLSLPQTCEPSEP